MARACTVLHHVDHAPTMPRLSDRIVIVSPLRRSRRTIWQHFSWRRVACSRSLRCAAPRARAPCQLASPPGPCSPRTDPSPPLQEGNLKLGTWQMVLWQPRWVFASTEALCYQKITADERPIGKEKRISFADIQQIEELEFGEVRLLACVAPAAMPAASSLSSSPQWRLESLASSGEGCGDGSGGGGRRRESAGTRLGCLHVPLGRKRRVGTCSRRPSLADRACFATHLRSLCCSVLDVTTPSRRRMNSSARYSSTTFASCESDGRFPTPQRCSLRRQIAVDCVAFP